jgi:asparagine synthase (glutamine-hydrolysing)
MNEFIGIIYKGYPSEDYTSKLSEFSKTSLGKLVFFSNSENSNLPFITGHLKSEEFRNIRSKYLDNQSFIANGKWSIVDIDSKKNKLYLVRDVPGICPLYYKSEADQFIFSNRLALIKKISVASFSLNIDRAIDFLGNGRIDHHKETLIKDVQEVKPSECVSVDLTTLKLESNRYFDSISNQDFENKDYDKVVALNRQSILDFVGLHNNSNKNATLLSGGIDSSCIAVTQNICDFKDLSFFTATYPNTTFDESNWAREMHKNLPKYQHVEIEIDANDFIQNVESMHDMIEFPTLSTGTINQYLLLKACNNYGCEIIWDGLGADALYGGHDFYRHHLMWELIKSLKLKAAYELLGWRNAVYRDLIAALKTGIKALSHDSVVIHRIFSKMRRDMSLFNPDFVRKLILKGEENLDPGNHTLKNRMKNDFFNGGVRHLSRFSDRIASHFDVDMNYPFSENIYLAQAISELPRNLLFNKGFSKSILRDSFKSELPESIYFRKDKIGMQSPNNQWIEKYSSSWIPYFDESLDGIYNTKYIRNNYAKIWSIGDKAENYQYFKHISFAIWHSRFDVR